MRRWQTILALLFRKNNAPPDGGAEIGTVKPRLLTVSSGKKRPSGFRQRIAASPTFLPI